MFPGVQILSARAHRDLPQNGDVFEHAYIPWLARGEYVASVTDDAPWMDIGVTLGHYLEANLALAGGAIRWPGIAPDARGVIAAPDARMDRGSHLELCTIAAGAEIGPRATLRRVVVWPHARVDEHLENAIVTSAGHVVQL